MGIEVDIEMVLVAVSKQKRLDDTEQNARVTIAENAGPLGSH